MYASKTASQKNGFAAKKRSDSQESKASVMTTSTVKSQRFADTASNNLYDVFKKFDSGKIDADGFIKQVESGVGIPATPEFISYVRTQKYTKCDYSKIAQSLNYNKDQRANATYNPPMNPYDLNFHRGQRNKKAGDGGASQNAFQERMANTIKDYTKGSINQNAFRASLGELNVPIDANIDKLIRKHESGDFQTYNQFGKEIFRKLNGDEFYNRVDKINMNSTKIVSPEKTGKEHFALADEIKQPKSRDIDNLHVEQQERHLGTVYVPKKGASKIQGVNQLHSSIGGVMKIEDNRRDNQSQMSSASARKFDYRDRTGNDIFNFSNAPDDSSQVGKRKVTNHQAVQNNGNLTYWDK
eukprot:403362357